MLIYTVWGLYPDEAEPELFAAVDELTHDVNGELLDGHLKAAADRFGPENVRRLDLDVPSGPIYALASIPEVVAVPVTPSEENPNAQ